MPSGAGEAVAVADGDVVPAGRASVELDAAGAASVRVVGAGTSCGAVVAPVTVLTVEVTVDTAEVSVLPDVDVSPADVVLPEGATVLVTVDVVPLTVPVRLEPTSANAVVGMTSNGAAIAATTTARFMGTPAVWPRCGFCAHCAP